MTVSVGCQSTPNRLLQSESERERDPAKVADVGLT